MMKSGCNRNDINAVKRLEIEGYNSAHISRALMVEEEVIKGFMRDPEGGMTAAELAGGTDFLDQALEDLKMQNENLRIDNDRLTKRNDKLERLVEDSGGEQSLFDKIKDKFSVDSKGEG